MLVFAVGRCSLRALPDEDSKTVGEFGEVGEVREVASDGSLKRQRPSEPPQSSLSPGPQPRR